MTCLVKADPRALRVKYRFDNAMSQTPGVDFTEHKQKRNTRVRLKDRKNMWVV